MRALPVVFRGDRAGDQFGNSSGAGPDAEVDILRKQGPARARSKVSNLGEDSSGRGVLCQETPSLLPKLHGGGNDGPPYSESVAKARRDGKDGPLGGGVV